MIEGRLAIDLYRNGEKGMRVEITSSRPAEVAEVFKGKEPAEVTRTLPLLFSVCAMAQGRAACLALARATGGKLEETSEAARECLVLAETAREHVLAAAMQWPGLLGEQVEPAHLRAFNCLLSEFRAVWFDGANPFDLAGSSQSEPGQVTRLIDALDAHLAGLVTGMPADAFLALETPEEFLAWARATDTAAARLTHRVLTKGWVQAGDGGRAFLPNLDDSDLLQRLLGDDGASFAAKPKWDGLPVETSAFSRCQDHTLVAALLVENGAGLIARLAARLVDLARIPGQLRVKAAVLSSGASAAAVPGMVDGAGLAQVEAARGRLVHGVIVDGGRVAEYRILAPTEWNFHPDGAAARGLAKLMPQKGSLEDQARLLIGLIDPCVAYDLRIH